MTDETETYEQLAQRYDALAKDFVSMEMQLAAILRKVGPVEFSKVELEGDEYTFNDQHEFVIEPTLTGGFRIWLRG